ncbi:hypothetical protein GCM10007981_08150 [Thermocladium modestius]|uniref:5'-deoxynucleotidase n=1 Tax=Thermocladium modestius TaxID=62609 RepID=A0A830GVZ4_9CREN|nr:HD domain-containing protein [Thermocladium modestius]GGP20366.1 hypothetical protein GCM10007981_08150 [Thermocladium modestius]
MDLDELPKIVDALCLLPRIGWVSRGIMNPETVGRHSLLAALIAAQLAKSLGLDVGRAALLALIHDVAEYRLGDVVRDVREIDMSYWRSMEQGIARDLGLGEEFEEYSMGDSKEAKVAAISDKLATFLRACIYARENASIIPLIKRYAEMIKPMLGSLGGEAALEIEGVIRKCLLNYSIHMD